MGKRGRGLSDKTAAILLPFNEVLGNIEGVMDVICTTLRKPRHPHP
jgi:hypothetical protein